MERQAFMDAVAQHQDMVYRVALHWFGVPQDAEDAVQEVFLRLYMEEKPFDGPEHLRRWLLRVTVNVCKDALKSPWRKRRVPMECIPEPVFEEPEQRELYREVLALPEKYRTVLGLYYYEELSTKEIAALLNIRQTAVTTRLARGREQLKKRLKEAWQDE
ncbi:MAG: RNA polymerase sigma factor [Pseudoflavonifractor capillosus]|uniref:RNA polymerase sigma factor n=1 Tax=Pseudoflavonifractor capillosus TaxID=106588 RepID=UPI0023F900C7|nr:RNA polymerase sigma factor [Pseudoflavonifractor capillosus]MCI5929241.1 RNA polymerase sigma factor [Pseudoflavonifractor capillosus]